MAGRFLQTPIQMITFDVHNVLLTVRNGAASQYARLAREHTTIRSMDESRLRANLLLAFGNLNRTHPGYGIHTQISSRQWWSLLIGQTFKDEHLSTKELDKLSVIIFDEFARGDMWTKHPQADRVLQELQKTKRLGVISNFDERLESLLEQHQLRQYFQFVLTPRTCGFYKPQAEIFDHAAKLSKVQSHGHLCHIGDDVRLDYRAALAVNCQAVLLAKDDEHKRALLHEHTDIPSDHVLVDLDALIGKLT